MKSNHYDLTVAAHNQFHVNHPKKWVGDSTVHYKDQIKELVDKYQAHSLLDYGCGKALHYTRDPVLNFGTEEHHKTFDEFLGVQEVYKYDPCVPEFSILPPAGKKFDAVILIQCISLVPDDDIPWVKQLLMEHTGKFCFIGNRHPSDAVKPIKAQLTANKEYFKATRTVEWYEEQFADWVGSELVFCFMNGENQ